MKTNGGKMANLIWNNKECPVQKVEREWSSICAISICLSLNHKTVHQVSERRLRQHKWASSIEQSNANASPSMSFRPLIITILCGLLKRKRGTHTHESKHFVSSVELCAVQFANNWSQMDSNKSETCQSTAVWLCLKAQTCLLMTDDRFEWED